MPKTKKPRKPGYHLSAIPRGEIGYSSKILEEVLELMDAEKQGSKVMALIELSDIVGAIQAYLKVQAKGFTFKDLEAMSEITRRAFENGHRK